jgi:hypothetical protein
LLSGKHQRDLEQSKIRMLPKYCSEPSTLHWQLEGPLHTQTRSLQIFR